MTRLHRGLTGLILAGVIGLGAGSYDAYRTYRAQQWPTTTAVIQSSDAERVWVGSRRGRYSWYPRVTYAYTVDGQTLTGSRITVAEGSLLAKLKLTDRGCDRRNAAAIVDRYPVGAQVSAHYNPSHPAELVLETDFSSATSLMLVLGGIVFLAGTIGWFKGRQNADS